MGLINNLQTFKRVRVFYVKKEGGEKGKGKKNTDEF